MRLRRAIACLCVTVGCLAAGMTASAASAAPINDNYLSSLVVPQASTTGTQALTYEDTPDTSLASVQADLFNPDRSGNPFGGGGPEPTRCGTTTYGKTVWYDLHPAIPAGVEIVASGFPTAVTVYQYDTQTAKIIREVACQASSGLNDFVLPSEIQPHRAYTVQVGGLPIAGGFAGGPLDFRATFFPDHDGDGVYDPLDRCPQLRGVPGFGGCPPPLTPIVRYTWSPTGGGIRLTSLKITNVPGGARVAGQCSRCGLRQTRTVGKRSSAVSLPALVGPTLPFGATLQILVSRAATGRGQFRYGAIGGSVSYTVGSSGLGSSVRRCLMPGSRTPRRHCP